MRVTHMMVSRSVLSDLTDASEKLSDTQRKLASGKQITRPSDDPFGTSRALSTRSDLAGVRQYRRNVDDGVSWQTVTDVALSKVADAGQRVRELLVRGASDTADPISRGAIAAEVDQLIESVKQEANASYAGRYVLAGTLTTTRPYQSGPADGYNGNTQPIAREIGPGVAVQVNESAVGLLGEGAAANDDRLLHVLRDVAAHLRAGNGEALRGTDLRRLDLNLDAINEARARVGATTNRLDTAAARLFELEEAAGRLLSETEDADMAKTMVDFSMQQAVYQSALKSGANIVQASLLDFLR